MSNPGVLWTYMAGGSASHILYPYLAGCAPREWRVTDDTGDPGFADIQGFLFNEEGKSFAGYWKRTNTVDGKTAITGKSNIADSLRWVLGEQSYTLLRGKKTEDMIFSGSEHSARAGMAQATVTFDNSTQWLPLEFAEVALSRYAHRAGRNEYLLNNQHVRLREINELLAQAGLSERTYTMLGQGLVDASLALKADDRRRLFEEAAGVGLYRTRRDEALRRLADTERNLERVLDILTELEPRLRSLERQAKRSIEFTRAQADLKLICVNGMLPLATGAEGIDGFARIRSCSGIARGGGAGNP